MLKSIMRVCLLTLTCLMLPAKADNPPDDNAKVKVQKNGDLIIIDLSMTVPVTPQEAWDVLVDFDHMTQILSNLDTSKILEKNGNQWKIEQKGQTSHAGFTYKFESTKLITLKPYETLQSHLIGGTLKQHESLTTLTPDGDGTRIVYHAESISGVWVPPLLGASVVEGEVRKQFHDMEAEMIKRNLAKTAK